MVCALVDEEEERRRSRAGRCYARCYAAVHCSMCSIYQQLKFYIASLILLT